jgi:oligopeptide/dipeptide ABC transporter ATP-binding protein
MIMQDPMTSLNPVFTIGNQIIEALALNRETDKRDYREQAVDMLRRVRLAEPETRMHEYQHQLSGGMRQRVVGAIALSCRPEVLIADEPTTSLDLTVQAQYLNLLRELQRETGVSIIIITHDFGIVAEMCDRVLVMYAGKVVESASLEQLFAKPSHPYTRALMECVPPVDRRPERLVSIEGQPPNPLALPAGCRFHPRCLVRMERCQREAPPDFVVEEGHRASCWRLEPGAPND